MILRLLKNTVLFFLIITVSCVNSQSKKSDTSNSTIDKSDQKFLTAAQNTATYLSYLKSKRVGVVSNQTSIINRTVLSNESINNRDYIHLVDSLISLGITINKVFSPEHGFRGQADAGELIKDGVDVKTGLTIVSLYGKNKKPTDEQLNDIDVMLFDIQDVGVRFYTYLSTLHYVMEACAENNIPLVVLDRPNPNGSIIDGPVMEVEHMSFLGLHPVPLVYGMTIGEYAYMINGEGWLKNGINCDLTVVPLSNYSHTYSYVLPVRPSPNLPNMQAIKLYPSLGLFEGTNINAGRGTDFQFQRYGAPFLDSTYYSFSYIPTPNFGSKSPKNNGELCYGVDLSKIEVPRSVNLTWLIEAYHHSKDKSKVFNTSNFTAHAGTTELQKQIESGMTEEEIKAGWQSDLAQFKIIRSKYLIYD